MNPPKLQARDEETDSTGMSPETFARKTPTLAQRLAFESHEEAVARRGAQATTNHSPSTTGGAEEKKTVILFGRVGDGKSSVGNMLLTGTLAEPFSVNNGLQRESSLCSILEEVGNVGSCWSVIEAPGFEGGKSPYTQNKQLRKRARELTTVGICYVKKSGPFTLVDAQCWQCFKQIFKHEESKILLVFTNCTKEWLEENSRPISTIYGDKYGRVAVNFAVPNVDTSIEYGLDEQRRAGKDALEEELGKLGRALVQPTRRKGVVKVKVKKAIKVAAGWMRQEATSQ